MPSKGSLTRQLIVVKTLQLFSVKGFYNTSVNDILEATNLTKGGLYGHFRSKEDIWYAVYDEAVKIWRSIVFKDVKQLSDPLERIETVIRQDLMEYVAMDVFEGGCFFINSLVELAGQSGAMSRHVLKGFVGFSGLLRQWLAEAHEKGMLKDGLNFKEIGNFIVITLNGSAALYISVRDTDILNHTFNQLKYYLGQLKPARE